METATVMMGMLLVWQTAAAIDVNNGLTCEFHDDGTCTLIHTDCEGDVVLPEYFVLEGKEYHLTSIGPEAFIDSKITGITIPASVRTIGEDAFRRCYRLEKVSAESLRGWTEIEFANEYASPLNGYHPLYIEGDLLTDLVMPEGITETREYSFFNCSSLESADLSGLKSIAPHSFDGCENLRQITISEGLTEIGDFSFNICNSLEAISLPESICSLGQGTFYGCSSLADIYMPESIEVIPALCFAGCHSIETLDFLPKSIYGIGDYAFHFCHGLTSAQLPGRTALLGDYVFNECESLTRAEIPCSGATLGEFIFANCTSLENVTLPEGIEFIPYGMFYECRSLLTVKIPSTVEDIREYAFADCVSMRYISFPESLKHIGERAMFGCGKVSSLEFPEGMEQIDAEAFVQCHDLKQIHVHSIEPFSISYFSFDWKADREADVYVPESSLQLYREDTYGWGNFDNLIGLAEYNPDTYVEIRWGNVRVGRAVGYGKTLTLNVANSDGSIPERVTFNRTELVPDETGIIVTPPVTGPAVLVIE